LTQCAAAALMAGNLVGNQAAKRLRIGCGSLADLMAIFFDSYRRKALQWNATLFHTAP